MAKTAAQKAEEKKKADAAKAAKTAAQKAEEKKKADAAKAAKAAALGGGKEESLVITEEYLAAHPELAAKGFEVGQTIVVPAGEGLGSIPEAEETEEEGRSAEDEASMKSEPRTAKIGDKTYPIWYVKSLGDGKFRLYNEVGQAVSPIVTEPLQINKAASRANALNQAKLK